MHGLITLRAARANLNLTRKQAADMFEIHHETLKSYEEDSTNIPRTFYLKLESIYGIPLDYIYFGNEKEHHKYLMNGRGILEGAV